MRIAFTGWAGSGKSEAAKYLELKYNLKRLSFADGIKKIAYDIFNEKEKNRYLLQSIGDKMREIDEDVWVNHTLNRINSAVCATGFVIDDLRRKNEFDALIKNFHIFRIIADEDIRINRLIKRDGYCNVGLLYNKSEKGCESIKLPEIENNGSIKEFYYKLDNVIKKYIIEKG